MIKPKVVSKQLIKPHTPTPQNLNNHKLSLIDEITQGDIGVLLFYGESKQNRGEFQESLAKTLVQFYPLAGRYNKKFSFVHCGDQGAEFVEAEALDVELNDVIGERNHEQLSGFFPYMNQKLVDESIGPLLSIQTTELKCGGLVLGIRVTHRIFDVSSLATFIESWSLNSRSGSSSISPIFNLFPSRNQIKNDDVDDSELDGFMTAKPVVKMFSFKNDATTSLRSKLGISRVRAVSAIIAKAMIELDRAKHGGESRPFVAVQAINIRGRTIPPLPRHSCGNLAIGTPWEVTTETREVGIKELADHLGDSIDKTLAHCTRILSVDENGFNDIVVKPLMDACQKCLRGEVCWLAFSDWSKFGFYEADFGWGKPVWTSNTGFPLTDFTVLMSNREGDAIEAWVHLNKDDMSLFEQNERIRVFTN